MTAQLDLLPFSCAKHAPAQSAGSATMERDRILHELEVRAARRFTEKAREFILGYLQAHGPSAGEDITDACKAAGITPGSGADDRTFGVVYAGLSREGLIVKTGSCLRRKGHATAGGIVWALPGQTNSETTKP